MVEGQYIFLEEIYEIPPKSEIFHKMPSLFDDRLCHSFGENKGSDFGYVRVMTNLLNMILCDLMLNEVRGMCDDYVRHCHIQSMSTDESLKISALLVANDSHGVSREAFVE